MDNIKMGSIIRERRKSKGLTQKDIAVQLNITDRAVSKWERGLCAPDIALLEPLSEILEISISDLISGELTQSDDRKLDEKIIETIHYSSEEITRKTAILSKKLVMVSIISFLLVILLILKNYSPIIFQRGNPLPYLKAAAHLDESHLYVEVDVRGPSLVYITSLHNNNRIDEILNDYAYDKGFEFVEQNGSCYVFTDGKNNLVIETEIYLNKYIVWTVPNVTLQN